MKTTLYYLMDTIGFVIEHPIERVGRWGVYAAEVDRLIAVKPYFETRQAAVEEAQRRHTREMEVERARKERRQEIQKRIYKYVKDGIPLGPIENRLSDDQKEAILDALDEAFAEKENIE